MNEGESRSRRRDKRYSLISRGLAAPNLRWQSGITAPQPTSRSRSISGDHSQDLDSLSVGMRKLSYDEEALSTIEGLPAPPRYRPQSLPVPVSTFFDDL